MFYLIETYSGSGRMSRIIDQAESYEALAAIVDAHSEILPYAAGDYEIIDEAAMTEREHYDIHLFGERDNRDPNCPLCQEKGGEIEMAEVRWRTVYSQYKVTCGDREATIEKAGEDYGYKWLVYGLSGIAIATGYAQSISDCKCAAEKHLAGRGD